MNKTLKKVLIIAGVSLAVIAAAVLVIVLVGNSSSGAVQVIGVGEMSIDGWALGSADSTDGIVSADKIQKVYASQTQVMKEIRVTQGVSVKEGDLLLSYDTTLSDIDLEKAELNVQRLELKLETARSDLVTISNLEPYSIVYVEPETREITYITVDTPKIISGTGTEEDPLRCLVDSEEAINEELLKKLLKEAPEPESKKVKKGEEETEIEPEPEEKQVYVALVTRYKNAVNGAIEQLWGLKVVEDEDGISVKYYYPNLTEEELMEGQPEEGYFKESGSYYSAEEIAALKTEKEMEIKNLQQELKTAKVDLEKVKTEISGNQVYAKFDGVVKAVRDYDECRSSGKPVIEISAGGGFYVEIGVSELKLDSISVGSMVTVTSWETETQCQGEVVSISEYPDTDGYYYTNGNSNVSYYPVKIFVSEEENLSEGNYVSVSIDQTESADSFFISSAYIRTDDGTYVYADNGGVLEKRKVTVGKTLWGSYTEILDGITMEDSVAFPYGKGVKEGAKTTTEGAIMYY